MRHRVLVMAVALGLLVAVGATTVSAQTGADGFQVAGGVEQENTFDAAKSLTDGSRRPIRHSWAGRAPR